jgi:short-subunit dehydrogenase
MHESTTTKRTILITGASKGIGRAFRKAGRFRTSGRGYCAERR